MKLYIAGPMAGMEHYNFPAFHAAAALLQKMGYETHNPADSESQTSLALPDLDKIPREWGGNSLTVTPGQIMREDFTALLACDGIAMLPGWMDSEGANAEALVAQMCRMPILMLLGEKLVHFENQNFHLMARAVRGKLEYAPEKKPLTR